MSIAHAGLFSRSSCLRSPRDTRPDSSCSLIFASRLHQYPLMQRPSPRARSRSQNIPHRFPFSSDQTTCVVFAARPTCLGIASVLQNHSLVQKATSNYFLQLHANSRIPLSKSLLSLGIAGQEWDCGARMAAFGHCPRRRRQNDAAWPMLQLLSPHRPPLYPLAHATLRSNIGACWNRNCFFRNDGYTVCMQADDNGIPLSKCSNPILSALLKTHLTNEIGRSIAYYDKQGRILGAAEWRVPNPLTFPVFICMRGQRRDDPSTDRTICRPALRDNDMKDAAAHTNECVVEGPSRPYADWCHHTKQAAPDKQKSFFERPVQTALFLILGASARPSPFARP
ncbi:hypothetical protein BKA62DRAFT_307763 [Auriculariales sp. MPI-PUGE-AT-0066]|nr:hypothetical protein BKA62DRAFT_307763 [Auriculariales sp. MPI-PUGE-AT-0066]